MSTAKLFDFGSATPNFDNLGFPDLARNLVLRLTAVKTLPDMEKLVSMLNPLLKAERVSEEKYVAFKCLRQGTYVKSTIPRRIFARIIFAFFNS